MSEDPFGDILIEIAHGQARRALRDLEDVDPPALSSHRRLRIWNLLHDVQLAERPGPSDIDDLDAQLDVIRRRLVRPGDDEGLWNLSLSMNQLRWVIEALLEPDLRRRVEIIAPHLIFH